MLDALMLETPIWLFHFNKETPVFHVSVLLLITNLIRHNIVKVDVDPRGDSWVGPQTTLHFEEDSKIFRSYTNKLNMISNITSSK